MGLSAKPEVARSRREPEVELDLGRYELRRGGHRIKLGKKAMELLILLVSRREQLVSREEIVARLWQSDLFIDTERNINNLVRKIRRALGDHAEKPRFLETVVGKGYRFVGPVRVIGPLYPSEAVAEPATRGAAAGTEWRKDRPSLAVLPLRVLGDAEDKGVGLGLADALTARLANMEGVDVLPASAVANVAPGWSAQEVGARLALRFVLHGAIQPSGPEPRLSLELVDCHHHSTCFARKFAFDPKSAFEPVDEIAAEIARTLNRPLLQSGRQARPRYSRNPLAYAEFIQGFQRSSSGDLRQLNESIQHLTNAVTRDPEFALAHAILAFASATRHFEFDPSRAWLDKAEFHCQRALELDPALPEAHVSNAFLLWGPMKNFQHEEAIAELKRALKLQKNLPHAYNRLGTILAHIGLLDHARTMYERGSAYHPEKKVSPSITQVYMWSGDYQRARVEVERWREETPENKYAIYFAPQPALLCGEWEEAYDLLQDAIARLPQEPLILSLEGLWNALVGKPAEAMHCVSLACESPRTFGHAHHTYYQIACIYSVLGTLSLAFEWLERSVDTGFACWPFFRKDPCLENMRSDPRFELLVSSLQAKYPDRLGLL